jgi:hypothetical protein
VKNASKIKEYIEKIDPKRITSISDLEIKEFDGGLLASEEKEAIKKFRRARMKKLQSKQAEEATYHAYFEYYRALGNLVDYRDILKEKLPL